jgi:hypothetical protein
MTVCIAAMYLSGYGFGLWAAADRLLTEGDSGLKSEPEMDKTFPLNARTMLFGAGDECDDHALWVATRHQRARRGRWTGWSNFSGLIVAEDVVTRGYAGSRPRGHLTYYNVMAEDDRRNISDGQTL